MYFLVDQAERAPMDSTDQEKLVDVLHQQLFPTCDVYN